MTMVLWNMDDYPIPAGIEDDLGFIVTNIEEVGHRMGFHGPMEISVYCKRIKCDVKEELRGKAGIYYLPTCSRTGADKPAPMDMTSFLVHHAVSVSGPYGPPDLVVFAKPLRELERVLECLRLRGHTILLIDPTAITGSFFSVESLLSCTRLLRPPTRTDLLSLLGDDFSFQEYQEAEKYLRDLSSKLEKDTSKIVDFFEPIRPVKENRTGVFWDAEDFPFPPFSTPDEMYAKIESALVERGFIHKLSIWVYLDDDKKGTWRDALLGGGGKKEWASRIYFLPGGDKASRRIRMANDIYFWVKDDKKNISFERISILFSDQFKDDAEYSEYSEMLQNLVACGSCCILSVSPTQDINKPESPEWP